MTSTTESSEDKIDVTRERFEKDWQDGKIPDISAFLVGYSGDDHQRVLVDLIELDLEYRWMQFNNLSTVHGNASNALLPMSGVLYLSDYQSKFSELTMEKIVRRSGL